MPPRAALVLSSGSIVSGGRRDNVIASGESPATSGCEQLRLASMPTLPLPSDGRWLAIAAQFALVAGLAAVAAWQIDLGSLGHSLADVDPRWLAVALALYVSSRLVHAGEWQLSLARVGRVPFIGLFGALLVGTLVNAVVPAAAGDVVKVQILANRYGLPRAGLVANRGAEAFVNAFVMTFFIILSFALPGESRTPWLLWLLGAAVSVSFVVSVVLLRRASDDPAEWRSLNLLPRRAHSSVVAHWPRVRDGLELMRDGRLLSIVVASNFIGWALDILIFWAFGHAFHLEISIAAFLSVTVVVGLITTFPITFGNAGTYEVALVSALALYGVPAHDGLAFAVGTHVISTAFNILLGLLAMVAMRLRPHEVFGRRRIALSARGVESEVPGS